MQFLSRLCEIVSGRLLKFRMATDSQLILCCHGAFLWWDHVRLRYVLICTTITMLESPMVYILKRGWLVPLYLHRFKWLTHLSLDKMAAISQTIYWNAFSWMKTIGNLFLKVKLTITQHCCIDGHWEGIYIHHNIKSLITNITLPFGVVSLRFIKVIY